MQGILRVPPVRRPDVGEDESEERDPFLHFPFRPSMRSREKKKRAGADLEENFIFHFS